MVWAALTLCRAWIAEGRPGGKQTLGMFESWTTVIGGILDVAGVPGLLGNAKQFRATAADTGGEWLAFVAAWWARHGQDTVGVKELYALATSEELLDAVLGDKGSRSERTRLGQALSKAADRVIGEYRICCLPEADHANLRRYKLVRVEPPSQKDSRSPADGGDGECEWSG
ncbi:MAG TPA: hypothetical protein VEL76_19220 [Gemmataceae bacterium]|nr:hypothetical protein [Gemmataceae bacterium]